MAQAARGRLRREDTRSPWPLHWEAKKNPPLYAQRALPSLPFLLRLPLPQPQLVLDAAVLQHRQRVGSPQRLCSQELPWGAGTCGRQL